MSSTTAESLPRSHVTIDAQSCKGCDLCVVACPQRNLRLSVLLNRNGYHPVEFHYHGERGECTACGICYWVCPDFAITEIKSLKKDDPCHTDCSRVKGFEFGDNSGHWIAANSVMFGAYLAVTGEELNLDQMREIFTSFFSGRKAAYIPLNLSGVERGYEFAENAMANPLTTRETGGRIR